MKRHDCQWPVSSAHGRPTAAAHKADACPRNYPGGAVTGYRRSMRSRRLCRGNRERPVKPVVVQRFMAATSGLVSLWRIGTAGPGRGTSTPTGRRRAHDADRTDTADGLHRPARPTVPSQPAHRRDLLRRAEAAPKVHPRAGRQAALRTRLGRPDTTMISGFLNHLENGPHSSVGTHNVRLTAIPLAVLLRRPASPRACQANPARAGHPQAVRQTHLTFLPARDRRSRRRPGPAQLGRPMGQGPDASGHPDRPAGFRTHGAELPRRHAGLGAKVHCEGKGRKQHAVPLAGPVEALLQIWMAERGRLPHAPLFPTRTGRDAAATSHPPTLVPAQLYISLL
jgi:hypothetical protein